MISVDDIARLAPFYDRYNNALDPTSDDCLQAKTQFENMVCTLHVARAAEVTFAEFRYELIRHCRAYLRKN